MANEEQNNPAQTGQAKSGLFERKPWLSTLLRVVVVVAMTDDKFVGAGGKRIGASPFERIFRLEKLRIDLRRAAQVEPTHAHHLVERQARIPGEHCHRSFIKRELHRDGPRRPHDWSRIVEPDAIAHHPISGHRGLGLAEGVGVDQRVTPTVAAEPDMRNECRAKKTDRGGVPASLVRG